MNRTRWFDICALALVFAVAIGITVSSCSAGSSSSGTTAPEAFDQRQNSADARPLALFIGDSYTAGDSSAEMSYGCRAATQRGWLCALAARGGTGYISGGPANRWVDPYVGESHSFRERISHLAAQYDPSIVILDGGRNDEFPPPGDTYHAMVTTLSEVRRTWPTAQIVFIRPRFLAHPKGDLGFNDDFMKRLAAEPAARGVVFIDPLSSFVGTDTSGLLGSDGIHPNHQGENLMTTALVKSLDLHHMGSAS